MNIKPVQDVVLVRMDKDPWRMGIGEVDAEGKTKGGVLLPDIEIDRYDRGGNTGVVVAVGPGLRDRKGNRKPVNLEVGQKVLFSRSHGIVHDENGVRHLFMREPDVTGVIE